MSSRVGLLCPSAANSRTILVSKLSSGQAGFVRGQGSSWYLHPGKWKPQKIQNIQLQKLVEELILLSLILCDNRWNLDHRSQTWNSHCCSFLDSRGDKTRLVLPPNSGARTIHFRHYMVSRYYEDYSISESWECDILIYTCGEMVQITPIDPMNSLTDQRI